MFNKERTYYYLLGFLIFIFVAVQLLQPKPLDWTESFSSTDKIPYGGYVIHELLPTVFPNEDITLNTAPLFEYADTSNFNKNWIFINTGFGPDQFETDILLSQVEKGVNVFIAARTFQGAISDSLGIGTTYNNPLLGDGSILDEDTTFVNFTNPNLQKEDGFPFYQSTTQTYFSDIDSSLSATKLGINEAGNTNFLKISYGEGMIFLHSNPTLFTNYFMRYESGAEYASKALSYLPVRTTIWDEYYKTVNRTGGSVVRYVVSQDHLRWAWILSLTGLVLFMIFRAKRKQRIIPEINPPKNSSIEFAKTIGDLYLEKGNHKLIAGKKIQFFFDYIRTNLALDTDTENKQLINDISNRSGIDHSEIEAVFDIIALTSEQDSITPKQLKTLTDRIDHFYKQTQR
jgi:hypothetical protein